jgi:hypothetical protein
VQVKVAQVGSSVWCAGEGYFSTWYGRTVLKRSTLFCYAGEGKGFSGSVIDDLAVFEGTVLKRCTLCAMQLTGRVLQAQYLLCTGEQYLSAVLCVVCR